MSQLFGPFHVVLVHLPIGILMLACVFQLLEKLERFSSLHTATSIAFGIGMVSAILSALTGYFLSLTGDYDGSLVTTHQWFGISVAGVSVMMFLLHRRANWLNLKIPVSVLLFLLIIVTGHLGGSLTHGSGYLTKAFSTSADSSNIPRKPIPHVQEALAYEDVIRPLLRSKCYSCHGPNKQKGKFRMDDSLFLMKGGKDGVVIIPGNTDKSEMNKRVSLPRESDDHMPPKEKPQLTTEEIALIHWWISSGASFSKKVKELEQPDEIKPALTALEHAPVNHVEVSDLPKTPVAQANEEAIKKLRGLGAVIEPIAQNTNYLSANFVSAMGFNDRSIALLQAIKEQLVELKLSHTSITDSSIETIAGCKNLLRVYLDHTLITDKNLSKLNGLADLQYLNLVGTDVTAEGVTQLKGLKKLRSIYLYQTGVKRGEWARLEKIFPGTLIDSGGYKIPYIETDTMEVKPPKTKQ